MKQKKVFDYVFAFIADSCCGRVLLVRIVFCGRGSEGARSRSAES